jgi:DNA-binding MarR family transcriptional regulator
MKSIGYLSFRLAHLFERRLDQRLKRHGVNIGQLRVMFVLWEAGEATQSDIARHLGVAQPTIAKTLERMQRDGFVEMNPDPKHGKRMLARLTRKAESFREPLLKEAQAVNDIATQGMTEAERERARRILSRLGNSLDQNK